MFNNSDIETNGEQNFFFNIKDNIKIIFDVGCRITSQYTNFTEEVHYFDPMNDYVECLRGQINLNKTSYFNNFGLGLVNDQLYYYPKYESFYNRTVTNCCDSKNKLLLPVRKGKDYAIEKNLTKIDFLKIDTQGYELNVLKGFEDFIQNVKIIQLQYSDTYLDSNTKLIDMKNYLEEKGFYKFSYLTYNGTELITDFNDHYNFCNIVCINQNSEYIPY